MEEQKNNNKQSEDINISLGTTVFIAVLSAISFLAFIVWVSLRIEGMV